jgi:hypothetical protein
VFWGFVFHLIGRRSTGMDAEKGLAISHRAPKLNVILTSNGLERVSILGGVDMTLKAMELYGMIAGDVVAIDRRLRGLPRQGANEPSYSVFDPTPMKRFLGVRHVNSDFMFDPQRIVFLDIAWFPPNEGRGEDEKYRVSFFFEGGVRKEVELTRRGYRSLKKRLGL